MKIVGQVQSLSGTQLSSSKKRIAKIKGIRIGDIVLGALRREKVPEPHEYVRQVCFESTAFLPVYYFIKKSGMTLDQTIEMLENVVSRSQSRPKLIERLKNQTTQKLSISSTDTPATIKKTGVRRFSPQQQNKHKKQNFWKGTFILSPSNTWFARESNQGQFKAFDKSLSELVQQALCLARTWAS